MQVWLREGATRNSGAIIIVVFIVTVMTGPSPSPSPVLWKRGWEDLTPTLPTPLPELRLRLSGPPAPSPAGGRAQHHPACSSRWHGPTSCHRGLEHLPPSTSSSPVIVSGVLPPQLPHLPTPGTSPLALSGTSPSPSNSPFESNSDPSSRCRRCHCFKAHGPWVMAGSLGCWETWPLQTLPEGRSDVGGHPGGWSPPRSACRWRGDLGGCWDGSQILIATSRLGFSPLLCHLCLVCLVSHSISTYLCPFLKSCKEPSFLSGRCLHLPAKRPWVSTSSPPDSVFCSAKWA